MADDLGAVVRRLAERVQDGHFCSRSGTCGLCVRRTNTYVKWPCGFVVLARGVLASSDVQLKDLYPEDYEAACRHNARVMRDGGFRQWAINCRACLDGEWGGGTLPCLWCGLTFGEYEQLHLGAAR